MLFVLAYQDEERTNDIVMTEVKGRKFREEASSRSMPAAIIGRIERARSTFTIRTTFTVRRGFPSQGDPRIQIPKREGSIRPTRRSQKYVEFFAPFRLPEKGVSSTSQFRGISLDRLGPSEKTSGPSELIIRRMYTRHKSCICHWRARGRERGRGRRAGAGSAAFYGTQTNDD